MTRPEPPIIDLRPDGSFTAPRFNTPGPQWTALAALAVFAAVTLAMMVFFLWLLIWLLPIALGAALITYTTLRLRRWWLTKSPQPPTAHGLWNQ